jgi:hypothetical protein
MTRHNEAGGRLMKTVAQVFLVRVKNLHIFQKGVGKMPILL